ncbi:hypothetical protein TUZN_0432 [Thermoproteus uzoniensis 768-20]|uniref:DUF192 domain-containing protein n=1 Tax=Thermoproteus uzoniensis (strain 768-20) TaxID=999630 RepID=F2L369_THEU7|nr:DUF192 domain-containing protein [Thermoproteus uzoniensis]AEA11928.1 hypothetical protein TUZN_0432 [Thermoproteus uzoniensis 768-20]
MRKWAWALVALAIALIAISLAAPHNAARSDDPFSRTVVVLLDGTPYTVYLADTPAKWTRGYMNSTSYDPRGVGAVGMLFLFGKNSTWCFWMHDTYIPLRIVWVEGVKVTGQIVAQPLNDTPICGYGDKALELNPEIPPPETVVVK